MTQYIKDLLELNALEIKLFENEKEYAVKHHLIPENVTILTEDTTQRFHDAYLERCEKETVNLIIVEAPIFFKEKVDHFKKHQGEFLYVEAPALRRIGVDALSMEIDDVFGTYTALFGLSISKKYEVDLKEFLNQNLKDEQGKYSISFSDEGGLWNMNLAVNYIEGFHEEMTLLEAYELVYRFIFSMLETVEATR